MSLVLRSPARRRAALPRPRRFRFRVRRAVPLLALVAILSTAARLAVSAGWVALPGTVAFPSFAAIALPSVSLPALALPSLPARAAALPDPWAFAAPALAELSETAVQVCSADAALRTASSPDEQGRWQARRADLDAKYRALSSDYESRIGARLLAGNVRPWAVPPAAPPLANTRDRSCLDVAKLPPRPVVPAPIAIPAPTGRYVTLEQLDAYAAMAGWPNQAGWWPDMRKIIQCESGLNLYAHNASDPNGGSYGLTQLNGRQHFDRSGENFDQRFDPVVNLRTALWLRTVRGHFGGSGGWKTCSELYGIT